MKKSIVCVLMWLSAILTVWTPTQAQANCSFARKVFWVSLPEDGKIAPNQVIFVAHSGYIGVSATLNGEPLEPTESGAFHYEYHPTSLWPVNEPQEFVVLVDDFDEQGKPITVKQSFTFSASDDISVEPVADISILSSYPSNPTPQTLCEVIFQGTHCAEDKPPEPFSLELSGTATAYLIERTGPTSNSSPNQLWPGECAPQLDKPFKDGCYRVVAIDALGQRHPGPENCDLFAEEDNLSEDASGCSSAGTRHGAPLSLALLLMLGALLRRKPS